MSAFKNKACQFCGEEFFPSNPNSKFCSVFCRLWSKVKISTDCWEWEAAKDSGGYGFFGIDSQNVVRAHRLTYETAFGQIPDGLLVCHRCDNPGCCRPSHMFLGTDKMNVDDMWAKGRQQSYENVPRGDRHYKRLQGVQ